MAAPLTLPKPHVRSMEYGQPSSWAHHAQRPQKTPTEADRFGEAASAFHFPNLQLNSFNNSQNRPNNASANVVAEDGDDEDSDGVDPLTAFLNPAPQRVAKVTNMQFDMTQHFNQQSSFNSGQMSTDTPSEFPNLANLLATGSHFGSGDDHSIADTGASDHGSVGLGFAAQHTSSPGSQQQGQYDPYGGEATDLASSSQGQGQDGSHTLQRSTSLGSFAHLLAEPQSDHLSWAHQRHYSHGNIPFSGTPTSATQTPSLLPPFNPSFDYSSGEPSGSREKPSLSLLTDTSTLTGGWESSEASAATYNSATSLVGPELTFSADPTTTTNTAFTTSVSERIDPFADGLHPDSAIDVYGKRPGYLEYRGRESSPLSAASDTRSRQPSPFSTSPYDEFPSITIRQPAEQTPSPYAPSATAFQDIKHPPTTRYIHPPLHRSPSSSSTNALPTTSHGLTHKPSRESPLVPRMAAFGLRDLNNVSHGAAQEQSWARLPSRPGTEAEVQAMLRPYIRTYLETSNKLLLGERTIVIMSTTVGQKSYGSERRFLVPPPSAYVLGSSWWTHLPTSFASTSQRKASSGGNPALQLFPPEVRVQMTHDSSINEPSLEWTTFNGNTVDRIATADDFVVAGRAVGKQLYIPDTSKDEQGKAEKDPKTSVEAVVHLISPGLGAEEDRTIASFTSKPIKVISKPSKKAQSNKKGNVHVTHGGTVALFNRLRSQTVSTRFLCVSSSAACFPAWDWQSMTGQEDKPFAGDQASCFTARTTAWDSFIIYAVDPRRPVHSEDGQSLPAPLPGYPSPPNNALPMPTNGCPLSIYYNQPVVLQCLNTAVVSPVMVIRRVDKGSLAAGGGIADPSKPTFDLPAGPGEVLGDAVSQLHKIALEVIPDPQAAYAAPCDPLAGFIGGGSYLSCLGENVGVRKAEGPRRDFGADPRASPNIGAVTPDKEGDDPFDVMLAGQAASLAAKNAALGRNSPPSAQDKGLLTPITNDGGKVKRGRRSTASLASPITTPKGRKRGNSSSGLASAVEAESNEGVWTQDAGEAGTWTIASTEIARHTFYIPPICFDGLAPYKCKATGCPDSFLTPIPSMPLQNLPIVLKYLVKDVETAPSQTSTSASASTQKTITLYGENFGPEWTVWFGDEPSPARSDSACAEVLECLAPPAETFDPQYPRHILLVRTDGIIVPSYIYWSP